MFHVNLIYFVQHEPVVMMSVMIACLISCSSELVDDKVLSLRGLLNVKEICLIFMGRNSQWTLQSSMSERLMVKAKSFNFLPCEKQSCFPFSQSLVIFSFVPRIFAPWKFAVSIFSIICLRIYKPVTFPDKVIFPVFSVSNLTSPISRWLKFPRNQNWKLKVQREFLFSENLSKSETSPITSKAQPALT